MSKDAKLIEFYKQCQSKGYTNMLDETQSLKAKVIAMDLDLRYKTIESLYEKAEAVYYADIEATKKLQQEKAEKEARLAVDGDWIMTVICDEDVYEEGGKKIAIYRRPDNSVYCTIDDGPKIEGGVSFSAEKYSSLSYRKHEGQILYTSVTVGGVTTGGFDTIGPTLTERVSYTGKGKVCLSCGKETFHAQKVKFPPIVAERFKRESIFTKYCWEGYNLYSMMDYDADTDDEYDRLRYASQHDYHDFVAAVSDLIGKRLYPMGICQEMVSFLSRVYRGDFPKSDKEIYESVANLPASASAAQLKTAIDQLEHCDYFLADKLRKELIPRYEEVLQKEKEAAVIQREKDAKTAKKTGLVLAIIAAIAVAVFFVVINFVVPAMNYNNAVALMDAGKYEEAIAAFEALGEYENSSTKISACESAILDEAYDAALSLMNANKYEEAIVAFTPIISHKDSKEKIASCKDAIAERDYATAITMLSAGNYTGALSLFDSLDGYKDSAKQADTIRPQLANKDMFSASSSHVVGLKQNGTVVAVGDNFKGECNVSKWSNIVAVSAGDGFTVGLKKDGSVVAVGAESKYINYGQCNVSKWSDIIAISAGSYHTIGLKSDGTVVGVGDNAFGQLDVKGWSDITAVSAGKDHTIGLKSDGTVVAAGANNYMPIAPYTDVSEWTDIVAISAGFELTVGLKSDGTVVVVGSKDYDVSSWRDIVAISAGTSYIVGLKSNGTVVSVGATNRGGRSSLNKWSDIIAVSAGEWFTVGMKSNGTIVAVGEKDVSGIPKICAAVSAWNNIKKP